MYWTAAHAFGGQPVDRRGLAKILQPRAVRADAFGRVVVGHHEKNVRTCCLVGLRLAKRKQPNQRKEAYQDESDTLHAKRQLPFGYGVLKAKLGQALGYLRW